LNIPIQDLPILKRDWQEVLGNVLDKEQKKRYYRNILAKGKRSSALVLNFGGEINMGNKFEQIGIKGSNNTIGGSFNQNMGIQGDVQNDNSSEIVEQIIKLREALGPQSMNIEVGKDIGRLSDAEENFRKGDRKTADSFLKKITQKTVEIAKTLGLGILANYISKLIL
jgi:hypothetical protein